MTSNLQRSAWLPLLLTGLCLLGPVTAALSDELMDGAAARIEQHRKATARILVVDAAGKPLPNAEVEIEQLSHAFLFGCNIFLWGRAGNEEDEALYRERFAELYNYATLPFYWPAYEPRRGQPQHDRITQVAQWCKQQGILTKGHPLAWNYADPRWLPDDPDEIHALQMERIDDCVTRMRNLIERWDVVNEATHFERDEFKRRAPKMTSMWEQVGRVAFVHECFQHARAANPQATLLINDYRTDASYEALLGQLVDEQGKPIFDALGIQSHMHGGTWNNRRIWDVCERFAKFGVPLHFTEVTILSGPLARQRAGRAREWASTAEGEKWQAGEIQRFYTLLFSHPAVEAITWWDFSDRRAWQGAPAGMLRKDMSPKPAYDRLLALVKGKWWTRLAQQTDSEGRTSFRGFLGRYRITVHAKGSQRAVRQMSLEKNQSKPTVIEVGRRSRRLPDCCARTSGRERPPDDSTSCPE